MGNQIGKNIHYLRKQQGLTQAELANLVKASFQAVSKWESGASSPEAHNIIRLARLYGISTDSILLGEFPVLETGDTVREMADTTFQEEEKPSAREKFPANSFLWAALGTVIVLILYLLTNLF